jgi:hypothetical protein
MSYPDLRVGLPMFIRRSRLPCPIAALRRDTFKIGRLGKLFQLEFSFPEKIQGK